MPRTATFAAIAGILFVIAAVLLFASGSTWLGILFVVLAVLELFIFLRSRAGATG
jgi:hypothetical protein